MCELLAKVRVEQRARWAVGEHVFVETYLDLYPTLVADDDLSLDLIYSEVLLREEFGEAVHATEYLRRFPRYATQLERQFELHALLRQAELKEPEELPDLPGFAVVRELGRGAWGIVYESLDAAGCRVAVKVQRYRTRPEQGALLRREAQLASRLNHPAITRLFGSGEADGRVYVVMELVDSGTLADVIAARGGFPAPAAALLIEAVARAVHFAHQCSVVHRDLKPANILLAADGAPKVTDFGLAKDVEGSSLVSGDAAIGTWRYMAPEQLAGRSHEVGPATDVYALGLILHELVTGQLPLRHADTTAGDEKAAADAGLPEDLRIVIETCLRVRPTDRYPTAAALADELVRCARGAGARGTVCRSRRRFVAAVATLAATAAVATTVVLRTTSLDSDSVARGIETELTAGKRVVLVSGRGPPAWSRWRVQGDSNQAPAGRWEEFSVQSWGLGLLELVRDPMRQSFTLTAEVRHDESDVTGEVGLYFGHHEAGGDAGVHSFAQLSFNDIRPAGLVSFTPCFHAAGGRKGRWSHHVQGFSRQFEPAPGPGHATWRRLVVEVSPGEIRAMWEGREVGRCRPDELTQTAAVALTQVLRKDPRHPFAPTARSEFAPRGGLGLYVLRGSASFRSVVLEPKSR